MSASAPIEDASVALGSTTIGSMTYTATVATAAAGTITYVECTFVAWDAGNAALVVGRTASAWTLVAGVATKIGTDQTYVGTTGRTGIAQGFYQSGTGLSFTHSGASIQATFTDNFNVGELPSHTASVALFASVRQVQ